VVNVNLRPAAIALGSSGGQWRNGEGGTKIEPRPCVETHYRAACQAFLLGRPPEALQSQLVAVLSTAQTAAILSGIGPFW
jgi:hypothetical protein